MDVYLIKFGRKYVIIILSNIMVHQTPKLKPWEAFLLALPFLAFIFVFSLAAGSLNLYWWPYVANNAGFWIPVVFCAIVYFYLLVNLIERRKGGWKWYREGLISIVVIVLFWCIISPIYKRSISIDERVKVKIFY